MELVKLLTRRFGEGFSPVESGNGDLIVPNRFKWVLGSTGRNDGIDLNLVYVSGNSELDGLLDQVTPSGAVQADVVFEA